MSEDTWKTPTPPPWHIHHDDTGWCNWTVRDKDNKVIAEVAFGADAKLMASAPVLLAALKSVLEMESRLPKELVVRYREIVEEAT